MPNLGDPHRQISCMRRSTTVSGSLRIHSILKSSPALCQLGKQGERDVNHLQMRHPTYLQQLKLRQVQKAIHCVWHPWCVYAGGRNLAEQSICHVIPHACKMATILAGTSVWERWDPHREFFEASMVSGGKSERCAVGQRCKERARKRGPLSRIRATACLPAHAVRSVVASPASGNCPLTIWRAECLLLLLLLTTFLSGVGLASYFVSLDRESCILWTLHLGWRR